MIVRSQNLMPRYSSMTLASGARLWNWIIAIIATTVQNRMEMHAAPDGHRLNDREVAELDAEIQQHDLGERREALELDHRDHRDDRAAEKRSDVGDYVRHAGKSAEKKRIVDAEQPQTGGCNRRDRDDCIHRFVAARRQLSAFSRRFFRHGERNPLHRTVSQRHGRRDDRDDPVPEPRAARQGHAAVSRHQVLRPHDHSDDDRRAQRASPSYSAGGVAVDRRPRLRADRHGRRRADRDGASGSHAAPARTPPAQGGYPHAAPRAVDANPNLRLLTWRRPPAGRRWPRDAASAAAL